MLSSFLRGRAITGAALLCFACGGRAGDGASPPSEVIVPVDDGAPPAPASTEPEPVPDTPVAVTPPGGEPVVTMPGRQVCQDHQLAEYCATSPACEYDHVLEDPYLLGYAASLEARCIPPTTSDAGSDAGAGSGCDAPSVADISCTCTNSTTGASYTLVNFGGGYSSLSLYYANDGNGPGALVSVVTGTDDCDECGCSTYYGERIDCSCPYAPPPTGPDRL